MALGKVWRWLRGPPPKRKESEDEFWARMLRAEKERKADEYRLRALDDNIDDWRRKRRGPDLSLDVLF